MKKTMEKKEEKVVAMKTYLIKKKRLHNIKRILQRTVNYWQKVRNQSTEKKLKNRILK